MTVSRLSTVFVGFFERSEMILRYFLLIFLLSAVCIFSVWRGTYNFDPHHWGLMLSNAQDLASGKIPYREIFIQYGFLTTVIHAIGYKLMGENLQSVIAITSMLYALGLLGIYQLSYRVSNSRKLAMYSFVTCVLVHTLAIYPWSNYIAFPFIVYGVFFALDPKPSKMSLFYAGLLFAIAVLCREGLFPAIFAIVIVISFLNRHLKVEASGGRSSGLVTFLVGFCIPLFSFFFYLWIAGNFHYWKVTAFDLPEIYSSIFLPNGLLFAVFDLGRRLLFEAYRFNVRIIFFCLVLASSVFTLFAVFFRMGSFYRRWDYFVVSMLSILLLSSALHLTEVFRLATGVGFGAIILYQLAARIKLDDILFFVFVICLLARVGYKTPDEIIYEPTPLQLSNTVSGEFPSQFGKQVWPKETFEYYLSFQGVMLAIDKAGCGVKYYYNDTMDAFLAVLSPFQQYQIAPFGHGLHSIPSLDSLRPDLDYQRKIQVDKDIVVFQGVPNDSVEKYDPPAGYVVITRLETPPVRYDPVKSSLLILVPQACAAKL
ncbi:hypothetical protein [Methylotenera sp.]|uniref:hypothetical protein n=1 Tax=Methylotenera sp. TaxID=2051956 RepID=UPI002EDB66B7